MVAKLLPHAKLKAKPNLESRIRTLKNNWKIIYDMLNKKDGSAFGWDEHKQMVVVGDVVWDFIYKCKLTTIYANDQATGKYAQTISNLVEKLQAKNDANERIHEEGSNDN
ncbi:hypothetical protein CXB51_002687 [Gossypium anomalum]|uniref:Myb/SANT-like domain-containing protein n=1 Tax=Gossypium anomalum TaxID=47600 RepID=A0A8J5Z144_9ROSI|nr:hypothetical protein CXB51_002687 [Gossypium anomalum]